MIGHGKARFGQLAEILMIVFDSKSIFAGFIV
jgi:hypothetical protein